MFSSFLRYLLFVYVGKWLDEKAKENFIIYDFISWKRNNYNKHIARYLKKYKASDNDIFDSK